MDHCKRARRLRDGLFFLAQTPNLSFGQVYPLSEEDVAMSGSSLSSKIRLISSFFTWRIFE